MELSSINSLIQSLYNQNPSKNFVNNATAGINNLTGKRVQDMLSQYSTTGLGRSGIQGAALNDIYATAGDNISNIQAQGAQMDYNNKAELIRQMLQSYQIDQQPSGWGEILGQVISGGAQIGAAALATPSDKKLKKKIKKVGMTKSGLPIKQFEYKDDPEHKIYQGHVAQDVEKKYPDAVYKVLDYSKLPKDAEFEEING